jgi:D-lactate dehydrogenase (cytochrome)
VLTILHGTHVIVDTVTYVSNITMTIPSTGTHSMSYLRKVAYQRKILFMSTDTRSSRIVHASEFILSLIFPKKSFHRQTAKRTKSTTTTTKTTKNETSNRHYESLINAIPHVEFVTNSYELERHGRGESHHPCCRPDIIALPKTVPHIQDIVRYCTKHRIPIIPFGAGTSVEGHIPALYGGISLDMNHFQSIRMLDEIDVNHEDDNDKQQQHNHDATIATQKTSHPDPIAIVGAGVTRKQLNERLRSTGYQFVVDPGANATIGGMFSTGASGTTTVKYGTMRQNVLAATVILPNDNASIIEIGTRALKNSAGYDLVSLFCGSEGTLGIVVDMTVKLHPIHEYINAAVCVFESIQDAVEVVSTLKLFDIPIVRCELLDAVSVQAFNSYNKTKKFNIPSMEVKPTLFLELESSNEVSLIASINQVKSICLNHDFQCTSFQVATNEEERKRLWSARHQLYYAAIAYRSGATSAIVTDACVPLSHFATILTETMHDVQELDVVGPCFGHVGDGNLHCILPISENDPPEYRNKLDIVANRLMERTLKVGGTCTGEHGIGYGKIKYLQQQYNTDTLQLMKVIKNAIDPYNIMNPGKVVPVS